MTKYLIASCVFAATICFQAATAQELTFGSDAPKFEVEKFLKGEPVKALEKGKIYVVELWATWCGPCREMFPHLTELQKKFEDVTFIGVAVLEEDPSILPDFVEKMGKKMGYRVAVDLVPDDDPREGKIAKNWMQAAELDGIPGAFIVNGERKIAWIGHPAELDQPLAAIVAGKWDLEAEAKKVAEVKETQKRFARIMGNLDKLYAQFNSDGKADDLLAAIDTAVQELPERATGLKMLQFHVLASTKDRVDEAVAVAEEISESKTSGEDPTVLSSLAWIVVNPERESKADAKLIAQALKVAKKADKIADGEDPSVVETLAVAYFDNGDFANALKEQTRLLEMVKGTPVAANPALRKRLNQFKRALENSKTKKDGKEEAPAATKKTKN